jgi:hypothetical protein
MLEGVDVRETRLTDIRGLPGSSLWIAFCDACGARIGDSIVHADLERRVSPRAERHRLTCVKLLSERWHKQEDGSYVVFVRRHTVKRPVPTVKVIVEPAGVAFRWRLKVGYKQRVGGYEGALSNAKSAGLKAAARYLRIEAGAEGSV